MLVLGVAAATLPACASNTPAPAASPSDMPEGMVTGDQGVAPTGRDGLGGPGASASPRPAAKPLAAGNPNGKAVVPAEARAVDTSKPTRTIGTGTPASCTSAAVVKAVAAGGVIAFDCGPAPATIKMAATAKVRNANGPKVVLDGGGKVTLSGQGKRRILYMNTCDEAQGWTTSHCQNQDHPQLTVQNLTLADGNSTGDRAEGGGGGAIFVRGGRLKVVNSRFVDNRCDRTGPDLGGAAIRVLSQYDNKPVYVVGSTFNGGSCSNGGALSSIGVSWVVLNSVLSRNEAIGNGANPAKSGTPGGGSGGAIYCDGNEFTVRIAGTIIENNKANEGGGAVFFVSNNRTGTMKIENSTLRRNPSGKFETRGYPGIFFLGARNPTVTGSKLA
ncbi:membrane protein [Micromonospora sp. NRRL B-16802]|nr:membrane protein [Micromonospora sp. NRRL B-16802]